MLRSVLVLFSAAMGLPAHAQATLEAPASSVPGREINVDWTGPGEKYDSIYAVAAGAPDDARGLTSKSILNARSPILLKLPDAPGEFELRYWSRAQKSVLARHRIILTDPPTSIEADDTAPIGSKLEVRWQGPGNKYDMVALYLADAPDNAKAARTASILGNKPLSLTLPETPGDYQLRYVTQMKKRVLARRALTITDVAASLDGPTQPKRGEVIEVSWTGPGNNYDRVEVHPTAAADTAKPLVATGIVNGKNPIAIKVPDAPGTYEYRYVTTQEKRILARMPFSIVDVDSALSAPDSTLASSPLWVTWTGPGNNYDRVDLVDPTDDAKALASGTILSNKNPVLLNVPDVEGEFELRYVTTQAGNVLATRPIRVQPAGSLRVTLESRSETATAGTAATGAIELILDASGSMLKKTDAGPRRIEVARQVLGTLVREHLPDNQPLAMRVFGDREANACRTDLAVSLTPLDREATGQIIDNIQAMNLAKTPIADSLAQVPNDLAGASGRKTVVLITDGEETCDGDPAAVIESLQQGGLDVQLSIVGFAIDDAALRETFEQWAALGGGSYFDAQSADDLLRSLRTVISGPFEAVDARGDVAGSGIIGGRAIVLPAGRYRIRMAASETWLGEVEVIAKEVVTFSPTPR